MRVGSPKSGRILVGIAVLALVAGACGGGGATTAPAESGAPAETAAPAETTAGSTEPVVVCELAYYTGAFAAYGPSLTNDVRFPIVDVINQDPPLGRPWELISEDIGDDHEGAAAKICLEQHKAEILVSIAHQYRTYRDYMMDYWEENDSPLGPSGSPPTPPRRPPASWGSTSSSASTSRPRSPPTGPRRRRSPTSSPMR